MAAASNSAQIQSRRVDTPVRRRRGCVDFSDHTTNLSSRAQRDRPKDAHAQSRDPASARTGNKPAGSSLCAMWLRPATRPKSNRAGRTLLSAAVASIFQTTPLICHPERSVIVRRTLTRSRGTQRLPAPTKKPAGSSLCAMWLRPATRPKSNRVGRTLLSAAVASIFQANH